MSRSESRSHLTSVSGAASSRDRARTGLVETELPPVHIAEAGTQPMSDEQHHAATQALASLISSWHAHTPTEVHLPGLREAA
jgi:hypothetical protein